jgi:hypothetical protein
MQIYNLFVEGESYTAYKIDENGTAIEVPDEMGDGIIAVSDAEAIVEAIKIARISCRAMDNVPHPDLKSDEAITAYLNYPITHAFKLYHQGRLVYEHTP